MDSVLHVDVKTNIKMPKNDGILPIVDNCNFSMAIIFVNEYCLINLPLPK